MYRGFVRRTKKIPYAVAAIVLFFLVVEGMARLGLKINARRLYGTDIAALKETNLKASAEKGWEWPGQFTFRKKNAEKEKPQGVFRIITTGDSCCWGALVPADYTFSAVLEKLLNDRFGAGRAEVLNAGVVGYNTWQVNRQIETQLAAYRPDLIVYYGTGSDAMLDRTEIGQDWKSAAFYRAIRVSKAFLLFTHLLRRPGKSPPPGREVNQGPLIDEMSVLATNAGSRLVLLEYLVYRNGLLSSDLAGRRANFEVPVVRTRDRFLATGLPLPKLMFDQVHPTAAGHRIVAECLFEEIVAQGRLGSAPTAAGQ